MATPAKAMATGASLPGAALAGGLGAAVSGHAAYTTQITSSAIAMLSYVR